MGKGWGAAAHTLLYRHLAGGMAVGESHLGSPKLPDVLPADVAGAGISSLIVERRSHINIISTNAALQSWYPSSLFGLSLGKGRVSTSKGQVDSMSAT